MTDAGGSRPQETRHQQGHQRRRLTPEESDESRRRKELAKSDLRLKLDAAELHIINLTRTIGQTDEKIKLMQDKLDRHEKYSDYLEKELTRLKLDPASEFMDLAFTASDHNNVIRIRDSMEHVVKGMNKLTEEVATLKLANVKRDLVSPLIADAVTRHGPSSTEAIPAGEGTAPLPWRQSVTEPSAKVNTVDSDMRGNPNCDTPTRLTFSEKVRKFSSLNSCDKTETKSPKNGDVTKL